MAYGKIKCDSIIYDNSGSDVEKTVASLAAATEGTAVISTGVTGTTKFLRVDGDGTCSWQVPDNTTYSIQDGELSQNNFTDADHTKLDGIAASANNYAISADLLDEDDMASNSNTKVPSQQSVKAYTDTTFAPKAAPAFTGTATGVNLTLSGNLTVNGTTTTINAATLDVEDKNIELGKVSSPSDTTADGGGITLKGTTDKTFNWVNSTDSWTANQHITVQKTGSADLQVGSTDASGARIFLDGDSNGDFTGSDYCEITHNTGGDLQIKCDNPASDSQFELYVGSGSTTALIAQAAGEVQLYHNGTLKANTDAAGFEVSGSVSDSKGDVRTVTLNINSSAYTLVASDAGKAVTNSSGGWTVNNNIFTAGQVVTFINNSGSDQTITQGSGVTIYNTADATTGNRTLAGRGMATLIFYNASSGYISGAGLS